MATDKRDRLIEAAKVLFYQQGVARSSLADIAQQAEIPVGNVYYHFRSKEALVEAVIQAHARDLYAMFARWEHYPDPRQRLLALLAMSRDQENTLTRYGCPHGSLCQELAKDDSDSQLAAMATGLFQIYLDWAESQFRQLGKDKQEAEDLAFNLIASLQGIYLLSFRSPALLERQLQRLETEIRSL